MRQLGSCLAAVGLLHLLVAPARAEPQFRQFSCSILAQEYLEDHGRHQAEEADPDHMLFFLHIPRTAGRTYHSCFLKQAYKPSRRCAKSYDVLRLEKSTPGCGFLSSHDDFSVTNLLPNNVAIVTQLRDPVDRVLSAYEFAIEVASRAVRHAPPPMDPKKVNTRNVWPWSQLVPFMEIDIRTRMHKFLQSGKNDNSTELDPYDNPIVMPLADFVEHPNVQETLHNGATLQVLGITNYSRWQHAERMRGCLIHHEVAKSALLKTALDRLDSFLHVGLFDRLDDSIASLAATLDKSLNGSSWVGTMPETVEPASKEPEWLAERAKNLTTWHSQAQGELFNAEKNVNALKANGSADTPEGKADLIKAELQVEHIRRRIITVEQEQIAVQGTQDGNYTFAWRDEWDEAYRSRWPLWRSFHMCVDRAQQRNHQRRVNSFKNLELADGRKVQFSRAARKQIDPKILDRIRELNHMDVALYEHGRKLFEAKVAQQQDAGILMSLYTKEDANLVEMTGAQHRKKLDETDEKHHHVRRMVQPQEEPPAPTPQPEPSAGKEEVPKGDHMELRRL